MAPPTPRRPGFSRRAQYSLFTGYVIAVGGCFVALLLLLTARFDAAGHSAIQQSISDIFSPLSSAGRQALSNMGSVGEHALAYVNAGSKNRAMRSELETARKKLVATQTILLENRRLKRLLALADRGEARIASARLVSSTGSNARRYATLDAGGSDGVRAGLPVIGPEGLVGRIVQSGRSSSRVLLIVDAGNVIPVKRLSDGLPALANGLGDGRLEIRPLLGTNKPLKPRDFFVTSGTGGIYRPGIPVAIAIRATRDGAIARPLAEPARFDFAFVEADYVVEPPIPANDQP